MSRLFPLISIVFLASCSSLSNPPVEPIKLETEPVVKQLKKVKPKSTAAFKSYQASYNYDLLLDKILSGHASKEAIKSNVLRVAKEHKIDPVLLLAVADVQSGARIKFVTNGRYGFIPLAKKQAKFVSALTGNPFGDVDDLLEIEKNLDYSANLFSIFKEASKGNNETALLAFNWPSDQLASFMEGKSSLPLAQKQFLKKLNDRYKKFWSGAASIKQQPVKAPAKEIVSSNYRLNSSLVDPKLYHKRLINILKDEGLNYSNRPALDQIVKALTEKSIESGFDPIFVASLVFIESSFDPTSQNGNKRGLMQVDQNQMSYIINLTKLKIDGEPDLINPIDNLSIGISYLKLCHEIFENNPYNSLAGYNWGAKQLIAALKAKSTLPSEIVSYPEKVMELYKTWKSKS